MVGNASAGLELKGSGSYIAAPLCARWLEEYAQGHSGIKVKFDAKGASDAVGQWLGKGVDFAASETPLTTMEENKVRGRGPLNLPLALEALAVTYNLPGIQPGLKISPAVLSSILNGTVKKWNDQALAIMNPGITLPDMDIMVVREEHQNTLHDFLPFYLSKLDSKWTLRHEKDKNLHWPVGVHVKGNNKVLERLRRYPGTLAVVDFSYAAQKGMPTAQVKNEAGKFVGPSVESIQASTSDLVNLPDDFKVFLTRSRGPEAYPLCTFLWLLTYQENTKVIHNSARSKAFADFLQWVSGDEGQKLVSECSYVPLPDSFLAQVRQKIQAIR